MIIYNIHIKWEVQSKQRATVNLIRLSLNLKLEKRRICEELRNTMKRKDLQHLLCRAMSVHVPLGKHFLTLGPTITLFPLQIYSIS